MYCVYVTVTVTFQIVNIFYRNVVKRSFVVTQVCLSPGLSTWNIWI